MKDFTVIVGAPGTEKKNPKEGPETSPGNEAKVRINLDGILDPLADLFSFCESRLADSERKEPSKAERAVEEQSGLKPYVVNLEAASVKEVPVNAASPEAAEKLAFEMYNTSDVLDFNDADVISVTPKVVEVEDKSLEERKAETMIELVRLIRSSDAPDDVLGLVLDRMFTDIFEANDIVTS